MVWLDAVLNPHDVGSVHDGTGTLDDAEEAGALLGAVAINLDGRILEEIVDPSELLFNLRLDLGLDEIQTHLGHFQLELENGHPPLSAQFALIRDFRPDAGRVVECLFGIPHRLVPVRELPSFQQKLVSVDDLRFLAGHNQSKTNTLLRPVVCHLILGIQDLLLNLEVEVADLIDVLLVHPIKDDIQFILSVGLDFLLDLLSVTSLNEGKMSAFHRHAIRVVLPVTIPVRPREDPQTQGAEERTSADAEDGRDRSGAVEALHTNHDEQTADEGGDDEDDRDDDVDDVLHGFAFV